MHLLKKGLDIDSAHFDLLYPVPLASSGEKVKQRFEQNLFSCMRQVPYSASSNETVDMVLFVNGLPIITLELKNHWTGQTAIDAQKQYRNRDLSQTLFHFGRCLAHFCLRYGRSLYDHQIGGVCYVFSCRLIWATTAVRAIRPIPMDTARRIYGKRCSAKPALPTLFSILCV